MNTHFRVYLYQKISRRNLAENFVGHEQDPELDPGMDIFKSRIRIQSEIVWIHNTVEKCHKLCFFYFSHSVLSDEIRINYCPNRYVNFC
jgi:hypothetical protein